MQNFDKKWWDALPENDKIRYKLHDAVADVICNQLSFNFGLSFGIWSFTMRFKNQDIEGWGFEYDARFVLNFYHSKTNITLQLEKDFKAYDLLTFPTEFPNLDSYCKFLTINMSKLMTKLATLIYDVDKIRANLQELQQEIEGHHKLLASETEFNAFGFFE